MEAILAAALLNRRGHSLIDCDVDLAQGLIRPPTHLWIGHPIGMMLCRVGSSKALKSNNINGGVGEETEYLLRIDLEGAARCSGVVGYCSAFAKVGFWNPTSGEVRYRLQSAKLIHQTVLSG
ncbi:MAG: hypothetical protein JSS20_20755 [Proteobacteria bacterium]|nr:hypothetical protein [Pseudomonadota bacterium]